MLQLPCKQQTMLISVSVAAMMLTGRNCCPAGDDTAPSHPTLSFASAVGRPLMSSPLLLLLDATATPASQYGKPSPLLLLLVDAASAAAAVPLPLLLLLLLTAAGSTTRFTSRPNF